MAGIAYSLLCLSELTRDEGYFNVAEEAIRYENSLYVPDIKNWLDLRLLQRRGDPGKPNFMVSWCHGAPGIGLGRLASRHLLNNDQTSIDINNAIETTLNYPVNGVDHLCCGNLGRADILLYASQKLNAPDFKTMALKIAASVIQNENDNGYYSLYDQTRANIQNFGFFQGLSGIGYELLRLAYPEMIRSVLIFE
jgi:lantibiotic modifying enzyme